MKTEQRTPYTEAQKAAYAAYFQAQFDAQKQIDKLIKKHAVKYRHGSIIDHGKALCMLPKEINAQIKAIRQNVEALKPIIQQP